MNHRRRMVRVLASSLALLLVAAASHAQPVFSGDPIDPASGAPYVIVPGAPLFSPGADERFLTGDDVVDHGRLGDVDLVVRSVAFSGAIPPAAGGVALAPVVIAGGAAIAAGSDVPFQMVLSDGAAVPAEGNPLRGPEMDGRAGLLLAYADLDGDGVIGPNAADGNADTQLELQESLAPIGRQVALFDAGTASGALALSLGAPASHGGLGVVLTGVALTGPSAPVFIDGPYITTVLPLLPPIDIRRVIGNKPRLPDPNYLIDLELLPEVGRWYLPAPGDAVVGDALAIPLDGSSPSVDLVQSRGGAAVGATLAVPLDGAFVADATRRVLPAVGAGGTRLPVEAVEAIALVDDGPGHGRTVVLFPSDRLGNPTDPGTAPLTVELQASPGLAITAPDSDGDPRHETITFTTATAAELTLDDGGGAGGGSSERLTVSAAAAPRAWMRVDLSPGAGLQPLGSAAARLTWRGAGHDRLAARALLPGGGLNAGSGALTINLASGGVPLFSRTLAAGALMVRGATLRYSDPRGAAGGRLALQLVSRAGDTKLRAVLAGATLPGAAATTLELTVSAGGQTFSGTLACNAAATATRCAR